MRNSHRRAVVCLAAIIALALSAPALAEMSFEGQVVFGDVTAVSAPFGGVVEKVYLRAGDLVNLGDPVAKLGTTMVYASAEGTVSGVFGQSGDSAEAIGTRYGGVMYIEPTNKYVISASTEKAYNSSATKYVRVGETVYLSCTQDGTHTGTGIVTSVAEANESGYTPYKLEVTGGDFYMGETVGVFRDPGYASNARIGRGTVTQNASIAVTGTGSILRVHVAAGDLVERGQLLFETVEGALDGLFATGDVIASDVAGVVATVDAAVGASAAKGGNLITVYPTDTFQIKVPVAEMDLSSIREGDHVTIEFEWNTENVQRCPGVVKTISHLSTAAEGAASAQYNAFIDFDADDSARLGMSVIVYVNQAQEGEPAGEAPDAESPQADPSGSEG